MFLLHKHGTLCVALLTVGAIATLVRVPVSAQNAGASAANGTIVYERDFKDETKLLDPTAYTPDIYSINADGTNDKALTTDGHSHSPVWMPDGQHILFVHDGAAQTDPNGKSYNPAELYVMDRDGGDLRLIRHFKRPIRFPFAAPSPDGQTLALTLPLSFPDDDLSPGLYLLPANSQGEIQSPALGLSGQVLPLWSPDGKRIAYSTGVGAKSATHIINTNGSGDLQITGPNLSAAIPEAWTPDGKRIYVMTPTNTFGLHVVDADGSGDIQIGDPNTNVTQAALSPDGKQIAFAGASLPKRELGIFVMNQDGTAVRFLTADPNWRGICASASWSPDGKQIAASCNGGCLHCVTRLFVFSPDGPSTKLTPLNDRHTSFPSFAPRP